MITGNQRTAYPSFQGSYNARTVETGTVLRSGIPPANINARSGSVTASLKKNVTPPHFTEDEIKDAFMNAVNILMKDRKQIQANFQAIETIAYSTKELEIERDKLYAEMESITNLMEQAIQNNARVALDQEKYNQEFDEMTERFNGVKKKYDAINEKIEDKKTRHIQAGRFIKTLLTEDETATFSPLLWQSLLDYATVSRDGKLTFVFRNGMEI